jgi:hypothetical protein
MNFQNANVVYIEVYYNEGNEGYDWFRTLKPLTQ